MRILNVVVVASVTAFVLPQGGLTERSRELERHLTREIVRLQAHFDSVDQELRSRDVSQLSREQQSARSELVAWLRDYRSEAAFPLNDAISEHAVPIFRDSRGVLCAMAYLIQRSGRADIVVDVATTRNTATIHQLADDARLVAWLDSTGLTLDEAARIQPWYGPPPEDASNRVSADYAIASLAFSGTALATAGVNIVSPSRMSGFLGLMAGALAVMNGVRRLDESGGTKRVATANTAIGAVSIGVGLRGFLVRKPEPMRPISESRARLSHVSLAPVVTNSLGRARLGVALSARF